MSVTVEQADREAAALLARSEHLGSGWADALKSGWADSDAFVQAFAAHRIAAEKATLERAAKVADAWAEAFPELTRASEPAVGAVTAAMSIAANIRGLP